MALCVQVSAPTHSVSSGHTPQVRQRRSLLIQVSIFRQYWILKKYIGISETKTIKLAIIDFDTLIRSYQTEYKALD
jgi:hypothetical protein